MGTDAVVFALAAIGLNVHFGYTGLLNFGQVAFVAVGAYGVAMGVGDLRPVDVAGHLPRPARRGGPGRPARHPDPAAARRLPGHRHHRRGRDRPPRRCAPASFREHHRRLRRPAGLRRPVLPTSTRCPATAGGSGSCTSARTTCGASAWSASTTAPPGCCSSAGAWSRCPRYVVYLLMRSPWGRVVKAHPRGRGRRPQPRQERQLLQDAGAHPRRRHRRPRRHHLRHLPPVGAARQLLDRAHLLRLHRPDPGRHGQDHGPDPRAR